MNLGMHSVFRIVYPIKIVLCVKQVKEERQMYHPLEI